MQYLSKPDNKEFRKTLKRDALVLLLTTMVVAMGIGLTLFYSVKYNW
jgi:hypothetical protein